MRKALYNTSSLTLKSYVWKAKNHLTTQSALSQTGMDFTSSFKKVLDLLFATTDFIMSFWRLVSVSRLQNFFLLGIEPNCFERESSRFNRIFERAKDSKRLPGINRKQRFTFWEKNWGFNFCFWKSFQYFNCFE